MATAQSIQLTCPACAGDSFEVRFIKAEGLASVRCAKCGGNFLLLDSEDYWFDVIQRGYPRVSRCSCKTTSFMLRCDYSFREDGDVRSVDVWTTCTSCRKNRCQASVDIDYGDTSDLITRPLRHCKNPKIIYDLKDISLYATRADIARVLDYLGRELNCSFVAWLRDSDKWIHRPLDCSGAQQTVLAESGQLRTEQYLRVYAMPRPIRIPDSAAGTLKKEDAFWKRHEVIRISSPTHMGIGTLRGLLFYIRFSNEYVEDDQVVQKSPQFRKATKKLHDWLSVEFVSWRGPNCFDNPNENLRIWGDRFAKGRTARGPT